MSDLISRQAAIEALKNDMASLDHIIKGMSANDVRLDAYVSQRNQVNYDIYTINNLPPALGTNLAEVGTDCISRQAAIEALYHVDEYNGRSVEAIRNLPPAQPEPKRGKWIKISPANIYECSECGKSVMTNDICAYDFCHGCGAEMEVSE